MLRFVLHARFSAPADDQQAGNGIDFGIHEGRQRIDGIPDAAVLHIAQAGLA